MTHAFGTPPAIAHDLPMITEQTDRPDATTRTREIKKTPADVMSKYSNYQLSSVRSDTP